MGNTVPVVCDEGTSNNDALSNKSSNPDTDQSHQTKRLSNENDPQKLTSSSPTTNPDSPKSSPEPSTFSPEPVTALEVIDLFETLQDDGYVSVEDRSSPSPRPSADIPDTNPPPSSQTAAQTITVKEAAISIDQDHLTPSNPTTDPVSDHHVPDDEMSPVQSTQNLSSNDSNLDPHDHDELNHDNEHRSNSDQHVEDGNSDCQTLNEMNHSVSPHPVSPEPEELPLVKHYKDEEETVDSLDDVIDVPIHWKLGDECDLFMRNERKWIKGEIVGTNKATHRIKVRCGKQIHEVLTDDPDLRMRTENQRVISIEVFEKFQRMVIDENPNMASLLQSVLMLPENADLQRALQPHDDSLVAMNPMIFLSVIMRESSDSDFSN